METCDAIRTRRDVRQYTDQPIARENLERILEARRRAPSSGNWQPWNFVVVTDREQLIELAKVWDQGGRHIAQLAATIALVAKGARGRAAPRLADVRLRPGNREHDAGSGRPRHRYWPFGSHLPRAGVAVLGFPDGYFAVYLIGLGYPADRPLRPITRPNRRPFDEVRHWNRW
jgi:nitroreductase